MNRTPRAELDELAALIDGALDLPPGTHFVERGAGGYRLFTRGGAKEVSPRLPAGAVADWMRAYLEGIETTRRIAAGSAR